MKSLAVVLALASSGCFTTWAITQATGSQHIWDEQARDQTMPLPGVEERLAVHLPLQTEFKTIHSADPAATAPTTREPLPFALTCSIDQHARDRVYHSAFRYGSRWKKMAAIAFLLEAGAAAFGYFADSTRDLDDPMKANNRSGLAVAGFFGLDALGTAAIFFIPRKEVYTEHEKQAVTKVRADCPDNLVLEIAGTTFPVDAAGRIGEVGELALDDWMRAPTGALALTLDGRIMQLQVTQRDQCAWMAARHPEEAQHCRPTTPTYGATTTTQAAPQRVTAVLSVPAGTLTALE